MQNFADQCLDLAQSVLGHNLKSIKEDGSIEPFKDEVSKENEPGHAALAIGEFFRATGQTNLGSYDLVDLAARTITGQVFMEKETENGLAFAALALLSFGPSKERNPVWERLMDATREKLDKHLLTKTDYENHYQSYNIAKAVTRFSIGLTKKDDTGKLIDKFIERIKTHSSNKFFNDNPEANKGVFDINGIQCFVTIRQALQLHANIHLRERKLPSLRTYAEKYIKLIPDLARQDGLGWCFGKGVGAYSQMHSISIILQALRDKWIPEDQKPKYFETLRKLFHFFFVTYLDQEQGYLVIRDAQREALPEHTTRMANFDAARYLSQWSRLAKSIGDENPSFYESSPSSKTTGRFIFFDKSHRKEQGLFIYQNAKNGMLFQLPLLGENTPESADSLAFPHCPGVFDWPANKYLPILQPELTFGENVIVPSFYGKHCTTGLGMHRSFYFRYDQPEVITKDQKIISGLGSYKVHWTFSEEKITSEFIFTAKKQVQLDAFQYVIALAFPHSDYAIGSFLTLGEESLRASVIKDDFQGTWADTEVVYENPNYKTYYGKIHYLQILKRDHPLQMRANQQYKLMIEFRPDVTTLAAPST